MSHFPSDEYMRGYEDGQRLGLVVPPRGGLPELQRRVWAWCAHVFAARPGWQDKRQRVQRFLEEALELAQSCELPREDAERLVGYVFGRPVGEPRQELGGTVITLAALAECLGLDAEAAGFTEMERVERPEVAEKVRAKQVAKDAVFEAPLRLPPIEQGAMVAHDAKPVPEAARAELARIEAERAAKAQRDAITTLALDSIRRPVSYDPLGHCVVDRENEKVLDVRGWGRLGYYPDGAQRQDAIGELLARLINEADAGGGDRG